MIKSVITDNGSVISYTQPAPVPADPRRVCDATTRHGTRCINTATAGGRCRWHPVTES